MYEAFLRAKKNKSNREEVLDFEYYIEKNLVTLVTEIKEEKYRIGKYKEFKVYEPK